MTQKIKELLLRDLCMRLPYKPKVKIGEYYDYIVIGIDFSKEKPIIVEIEGIGERIEVYCESIKPFLHLMSSMTQEEEREYYSTYLGLCETLETYDWLYAHHFDYRGLINKGLALEAPKGMYN